MRGTEEDRGGRGVVATERKKEQQEGEERRA